MILNAEEYLQMIPMWTKKKNTVADIRAFVRELHLSCPNIIHVAGTNGKGSVCADLTAILLEAGYHTGTFISPHLIDVRERFLLDGQMVSEEIFQDTFDRVMPVVKKMTEAGYCHPSYFEFCFLVAMKLFSDSRVDFGILETGLGGRLDATNAVEEPKACVITSISFDHTQYLGNTIAQIAGEKAGIVKTGIPVIYDDNCPEASDVIRQRAEELHAPAFPVSEQTMPEPVTATEFAAPYQRMNAALAVKTLEILKLPHIDTLTCRRGLAKVHWRGRMEEVAPGIWLDGAHNPGGISAFIRTVKEQLVRSGGFAIHLLFAAVADKDYNEMIRMLCGELSPDHVTVAHIQSERSADQEKLAGLFCAGGCRTVEQYSSVDEALCAALAKHGKSDRLYIIGSLYLIGEIMERWNHDRF